MPDSTSSITSKVIAGVLTAAALWSLSKIPGALQWLKGIFSLFWSHIKGTSALPNWGLYLLVLTAIYTAIHLASLVYRPKGPRVTEYNQDNFLGLIWRWSFIAGNPSNIWAYCPNCDTVLVYGHKYDRGNTETVLTCETCNRPVLNHEGDKDYLVAKIHRQVERKIRTGEWTKAIKPMS